MGRLIVAVVICPHGPLADGLRAILSTIPQIQSIRHLDNMPAALTEVSENSPRLALLDFRTLDHQVTRALRQIKSSSPDTMCVVLADDVVQQHEAKAAGADAALLKGCLAADLLRVLEDLVGLTGSGSQGFGAA